MHDQFSTWGGFFATVKGQFAKYNDPAALKLLDEPVRPVHAPAGLVQLSVKTEATEEVEA